MIASTENGSTRSTAPAEIWRYRVNRFLSPKCDVSSTDRDVIETTARTRKYKLASTNRATKHMVAILSFFTCIRCMRAFSKATDAT